MVVPDVHYNGLTFEEMIEKNFTFQSANWETIKNMVVGSTLSWNKKNSGIIYKEKLLVERLVPRKSEKYRDPFNWSAIIDEHSESNRRALVLTQGAEDNYRSMSSMLGWDVVVGKEQFFNVPRSWTFTAVERASLLAESVERINEAGFISYFTKLCESEYGEAIAASVRDHAMMQGKSREDSSGMSAVTLEDPLTRESLVLLLYGLLTAVAVFVMEVLPRAWCRH